MGSLKATARDGGGGITLIFLLTRKGSVLVLKMVREAYYGVVEVDLEVVVKGTWRRAETCDM